MTTKKSNCCDWNTLPSYVLLKIFQYLDSDLDICRSAQVSKYWHEIAEDPTLREVVTIDISGTGCVNSLAGLDVTGTSQFSPISSSSSDSSQSSPKSVGNNQVGEIEESLALLPKRCSRLVTLDIRQLPPNCIDGLLASFISECSDLQDLLLSFMAPSLNNFTLCQLALTSHLKSITIDAALLSSENSYEQLGYCRFLESVTFTALGSYNPYEFVIGLQIFFSECESPLSKITLPEYAPLSSHTLSISLVNLICLKYSSTLTILNIWPIRSTNEVVDSLCSLENLSNLCLFEAKFNRFTTELWQKLNRRLETCSLFQISHSVLLPQTVNNFVKELYPSIRELVCVSCEFDDDASLLSFLSKFKTVKILEFHLHYGISQHVPLFISKNFTQIHSLTLSDLTLPVQKNDRQRLLQAFDWLRFAPIKTLSLAFIHKSEEDQEEVGQSFDSLTEVAQLRQILRSMFANCELNIELDAI